LLKAMTASILARSASSCTWAEIASMAVEQLAQIVGAHVLGADQFDGGNAGVLDDGELVIDGAGIAQRVHLHGDGQRRLALGGGILRRDRIYPGQNETGDGRTQQ
jgi:hypothetical protein